MTKNICSLTGTEATLYPTRRMIRERWTVLFLRGDADTVRQYSLPLPTVRRGLVGLGVFGALLAVAVAFLVYDSGARLRAGQLARANSLLVTELESVRAQVADFEVQIGVLAETDRRTRLLAGRMGIDEEVFEVGVGGPGLDSPGEGELWALDPEASELAYANRYTIDLLERKADVLEESLGETEGTMEGHLERLEAVPSILPVNGLLSSAFSLSRPHPIHKVDMPHEGIDLNAYYGTRFVATGGGVVTFAGRKSGYGLMVEVDHGFGYTTRYAHASTLLVHRGKRVERDEVIAQVGCTGVCTAPHVHYEIHYNGEPVDPLNYVLRRYTP